MGPPIVKLCSDPQKCNSPVIFGQTAFSNLYTHIFANFTFVMLTQNEVSEVKKIKLSTSSGFSDKYRNPTNTQEKEEELSPTNGDENQPSQDVFFGFYSGP